MQLKKGYLLTTIAGKIVKAGGAFRGYVSGKVAKHRLQIFGVEDLPASEVQVQVSLGSFAVLKV